MGQLDMAGVKQKCKEELRSMEEASRAEGKSHCKRCYRLVLEHDLALKEIEVVDGAGAFSPALTELLQIIVDGKRLVSDCLSSTESNSLSLGTSYCLHVRKLYACVSVLKCVDAEAAGKEVAGVLDFEYGPSTEKEVKAKVSRMQDICKTLGGKKQLGGKKKKADIRKICVDELDFQEKEDFCIMGDFGPVLKCSWSTKTVAVKMLPGVQEGLVRSEALRLVGLQHPHLVQVIGYGFDDTKNTGFLVMEFLERSLETFLQEWSGGDSEERAACPFAVALPILSEVAMAVNDLRNRSRNHDDAHLNLSIRNVFVVPATSVEEFSMTEDHHVHAKLIPTSTIIKPDSVQNSSVDVSEFASMGVQILGDGKEEGGLTLSTFLTRYLQSCLDRNPEGRRPSFPEICEMLQLCKNIGTRGIYFPSRFPSINKIYAEKLYKLLGLECFTSTIAENGSFLYPEIFLEVLVHALHELPSTDHTELKSAEWKERLLRASRCCGGYWTTPSLKISDPLVIVDAIEKNLEGEAVWRLGLCYELGSVVDVDETKAVSMYENASAQGFIPANVDLGLCFAFGKGVQEDLQRANELWTEAIKYQDMEKKPLASMSELVQSLRIMLSKSGGSEQKRATSVSELVQLVKSIFIGNTNRSEDSATLEISRRILKLSQKSADLGPQLVAGPSCCNVAELLELRGTLIVDDILRHLAKRSATIKEYLLEHQAAAIPVSHTATLRGIAAMGWEVWLSDRCWDGLKIFWQFIVFIFSTYASLFMGFAIPVGMAAYFSTSSTPNFWLAGVSLLALLLIYWTRPWILKIMLLHKLMSLSSGTVPNLWYRIIKAVILGKPELLSTGPRMPRTFWEACRQSPLVGMTEDDPDCLPPAELFERVFRNPNEGNISELSAHILSRGDQSTPHQYRLVPLREIVGSHIPDDYFESADRWELDNLGETSELKEHVEHRARRSESSDIDRRWGLVRVDSQVDTSPETAGDRPTMTGIENDPTISDEGLTFVLFPKSQLPPPYRLATVQEVIDNRKALFDAMPEWQIASLADGSVDGKLYGGRIGVERDKAGEHLAIKDPSISDVGQPTFKLFPVSDQLPQQYRLVTVQEVNDNLAALFEAMLEVRPPQREVAHLADGSVVGKRIGIQRNLTRPVKLPNVDFQLATMIAPNGSV